MASAVVGHVKAYVFILADDLGYGDLHCYGNDEVRTPNIDLWRPQARGSRSAMPVVRCRRPHVAR